MKTKVNKSQKIIDLQESIEAQKKKEKPNYLAYAVALAKKYGHVSPGQVKYVAEKQENTDKIFTSSVNSIENEVIRRSNLFFKTYNEMGIPIYSLYPHLKENNILNENLDTFLSVAGILTSGVLTTLIAVKGYKIAGLLGNLFTIFSDYVDDLENKISQEDFDKHLKTIQVTKKIALKFSNDKVFNRLVKELGEYAEPDNINKLNDYEKNKIITLSKMLEVYLRKNLSDEEKKYIKDIVKIISGYDN